jgi:hypothetical protein
MLRMQVDQGRRQETVARKREQHAWGRQDHPARMPTMEATEGTVDAPLHG